MLSRARSQLYSKRELTEQKSETDLLLDLLRGDAFSESVVESSVHVLEVLCSGSSSLSLGRPVESATSGVSLLLEMVSASTGDSGDDMGLIIAGTARCRSLGHFLVDS